MKVSNPVMSGAAIGSMSGMTFGKWRGMPVVRRKPNPVFRMRASQPSNRSRLGFLAAKWGYLTEEERGLWRVWASQHPKPDGFGGTFLQSGANAFTELGIRQMMSQNVGSPNNTPPVTELDVSIDTLSAGDGLVDGAIILTWTMNGTGSDADRVEIGMAGPFASPGVFDSAGHFAVDSYTDGDVLTKTITGLIVDAWYWFRVRYVRDDGLASNYLVVQWQAPDVA